MSKILEHNFFLSYKINYFKSSAVDTTLSQQNLRGKLLKVGQKVMLIVAFNKNQLQFATQYFLLNYCENIVKVALK